MIASGLRVPPAGFRLLAESSAGIMLVIEPAPAGLFDLYREDPVCLVLQVTEGLSAIDAAKALDDEIARDPYLTWAFKLWHAEGDAAFKDDYAPLLSAGKPERIGDLSSFALPRDRAAMVRHPRDLQKVAFIGNAVWPGIWDVALPVADGFTVNRQAAADSIASALVENSGDPLWARATGMLLARRHPLSMRNVTGGMAATLIAWPKGGQNA